MKYPKAFEQWYSLHVFPYGLLERNNYKQAAYNAWKAGRNHQKKLAYAYGNVVRYV